MKPEAEANSRQYWDKTWARFLKHQGMIAPSAKLIQHLLPHVPRNRWVLDLGCGEGRNTIYLGRIGFHSVGVDLSPKAVKVLANNLFEEESRGVCLVGDARQLPFAGGSFDGILAHHLFDHLDGKGFQLAIGEAFRVLKPDGVLLMTMGPFAGLRTEKEVVCRDDGSIVFTRGPNKGMLVRPFEDSKPETLAEQGWKILKDERAPRGSRIMLLKRGCAAPASET